MAQHMAAEGFGPARIAVVHNGVPELATVLDRPPPAGCWTLGVVALFRPRKGIEILLDAMSLLHQKGIPVRLRAIGSFESASYEAEIASRTRQLDLAGHVTWTGFANNVTEELRQLDLLVLPSLFGEGLPMVVLEAMAAGVPVVATRVPGVPEAIRHGREGILAEPNSAVELARAIAGVTEGRWDWSALRARALARHARLFSDRIMAAGVAAVYNEILDVPTE
jgi:glycosyltransferase involved in cell wall biosynthesis